MVLQTSSQVSSTTTSGKSLKKHPFKTLNVIKEGVQSKDTAITEKCGTGAVFMKKRLTPAAMRYKKIKAANTLKKTTRTTTSVVAARVKEIEIRTKTNKYVKKTQPPPKASTTTSHHKPKTTIIAPRRKELERKILVAKALARNKRPKTSTKKSNSDFLAIFLSHVLVLVIGAVISTILAELNAITNETLTSSSTPLLLLEPPLLLTHKPPVQLLQSSSSSYHNSLVENETTLAAFDILSKEYDSVMEQQQQFILNLDNASSVLEILSSSSPLFVKEDNSSSTKIDDDVLVINLKAINVSTTDRDALPTTKVVTEFKSTNAVAIRKVLGPFQAPNRRSRRRHREKLQNFPFQDIISALPWLTTTLAFLGAVYYLIGPSDICYHTPTLEDRRHAGLYMTKGVRRSYRLQSHRNAGGCRRRTSSIISSTKYFMK